MHALLFSLYNTSENRSTGKVRVAWPYRYPSSLPKLDPVLEGLRFQHSMLSDSFRSATCIPTPSMVVNLEMAQADYKYKPS